MKLRLVEADRRARVAVVGARTADGTRLRAALAAHGTPGTRVDLYGATGGEVVLSDYDGEARVVQEPDLDEIAQHQVVFLCEPGDVARDLPRRARADGLIIDLSDCLPDRVRRPRVHLDINPDAASAPGCYAVPHPLALLLGELLHPLECRVGLAEVVAVILRPASDFGDAGVEELRDQTVHLLSFSPVPTGTFGVQLAFNVLPEGRLADREPGLERRIPTELSELLAWRECRASVRLLTVPLFYGHAIQLRVRLPRRVDRDEVRRAFVDAGLWADTEEGRPTTPLEVTEERRTCVAECVEDGLGGFWIWAVAGETGAKAATQAVRLAAHLAPL